MATITEDYVSFETAKLLREKGFKESTLAYAYGEGMIAYFSRPKTIDNMSVEAGKYPLPTLQMAMKWLRKEHYCHIIIDYTFTADANLSEEYVSYCYNVENAKTYIQYTHNEWYNTYEEAGESAIKYCLENLI